MFLAGKPHSREMRFLQSVFDPRRLGQKRLFVARNRAGGRIQGFVACNPCGGRTWVMETCRQRPDAVRGTTAFIIHQAMQQFKAEGVLRVSLCLLPGLRCGTPLPGDSRMVRWGLAIGTGRFCPAFETAGAYHFKSRFRPRFENRYLCVRPRMTFGTAVAFIRLLGVMELDPRRLVRLAVERWRKRASRATLLTPEGE
jgi:phosphatidylglycerol lysyltransferase